MADKGYAPGIAFSDVFFFDFDVLAVAYIVGVGKYSFAGDYKS